MVSEVPREARVRHTQMKPAFGVEFPDCLAHMPQDLLELGAGKLRVGSHQAQQGVPEVGIDNDAVRGAEIDGQAEPAGARELVGEATG